MTTITIERELLERALDALDNSIDVVYEEYTDAVQRYANIPSRKAKLDGLAAMAKAHLDTYEAIRTALAAPDDIAAEMSTVADQYAHKLALDLECVLADYSGTWYDTAMTTLGAYREAMNTIHERESPTFMGEPVIRPTQAAPATFDVETLIEIVTDIRQYINHGVASEKFEALQRPGYGTGIYTHISNQLNKIMAILAAPATAPDRHAQELLAMEITLQNMAERHAQELCAYQITVDKLRAERKPMTDEQTLAKWNDLYLEYGLNEFDYYRRGKDDAEAFHGIKGTP